jgi:hypothetical protein
MPRRRIGNRQPPPPRAKAKPKERKFSDVATTGGGSGGTRSRTLTPGKTSRGVTGTRGRAAARTSTSRTARAPNRPSTFLGVEPAKSVRSKPDTTYSKDGRLRTIRRRTTRTPARIVRTTDRALNRGGTTSLAPGIVVRTRRRPRNTRVIGRHPRR